MRECDVLIAGGGHAGLTMAAALGGHFDVRVIDRQFSAAPRSVAVHGRTLAMLGGSAEIMQSLGIWRELEAHATPIWRTEVHERQESLIYDAEELLGQPFGYGFENEVLRAALQRAAWHRCTSDPFMTGRVVSVARRPDCVDVSTENGVAISARLVIGADGRGSIIRSLAGIKTDQRAYPQSALTFIIRHKRPHRFAVREFIRPEGPLAMLPLEGHRAGITWVNEASVSDRLRRLSRRALADEFEPYLKDALGEIEIESDVLAYPLGALHARRYVAPRLALIGDAAHGVHPIHAQGFNMGVQDIAVLRNLLISQKGRRDPGSADLLIAYERQRKPANRTRLFITDMLARILSTDLIPVSAARKAVFQTLGAVTPLRRVAVRQGMQLS